MRTLLKLEGRELLKVMHVRLESRELLKVMHVHLESLEQQGCSFGQAVRSKREYSLRLKIGSNSEVCPP